MASTLFNFKVIQGHRFWCQSKAQLCDFEFVINTNLHLTLFPSYCRLLVKFALSIGVPLFNTLVRGDPLNYDHEIRPQEIRNIPLSCGAKCFLIECTV